MQKVNRIEWIDWLKGLAIFCVVLGHLMPVLSAYAMDLSTINGSVNSIIMSFNMPLFAVLSGYFFSANIGVLDFLGKKCRQLAMPFIVWCFIVFVLYPNIKSLVYGERIYIFATLRNYYYGLIDWAWWFIRALFLCFIYAYFSVRLFRYNYLLAFVGSIMFLCIISFLGIIPNKLHFSLSFFLFWPFVTISIKEYYY